MVYLILYILILFALSRIAGNGSNDAFFRGGRTSPWPLVAFGMVGASISGITFIGVPGWAMSIDMTYMQMCFGFIVGYIVVAFVLLPLYYKLGLTSIYTYLLKRFGKNSYKTGAYFFIISKLLGSAAKFYVVVKVLQICIAKDYSWFGTGIVSYITTATIALAFIWCYTRKSGIRAIVWTDALQTLCLLLALILILLKVCSMLNLGFGEAMTAVWNDPHSKMFELEDWTSRQYFWKQFLSGIFVVIVMTGLDQDMMQKNLTCNSLKSAQKDMCTYGLLFAPVNFLFLALGILLIMLYPQLGLDLPPKGDSLLTDIVLDGHLGTAATAFFTIGIVASAFSSADSSMTALTTTYCIDILENEHDEKVRKKVHVCMTAAFLVFTLLFNSFGNSSVMDLIYTLVSYTYGPLLGLFAFGMFTKRMPCERWVPAVAIASPIICFVIDKITYLYTGYKFGYEMLTFNGMLTFVGLYLLSNNNKNQEK